MKGEIPMMKDENPDDMGGIQVFEERMRGLLIG